jgi:ABC-2 type transport system permease protein
MSVATTIVEKLKWLYRLLLVDEEPQDEYGWLRKKGLHALYRKELADHFKSKRFLIVLLLIAVTGIASIYSASLGIQEALGKESNDFVFLKLFTSSGNALPSFTAFISFLGPLVGLALGFDAINGERARGTLSRVLAQPIHRDAVVNGKFLAGVSVLTIMIVALGLAVGGLGIILTGVPPSFEELMRLLLFIVITIVYMSLWLSLSLFFSLLFKQTATSALAGIAVWLFFAIFMGLLAGLISNAVFPIDDTSPATLVLSNQQLQQNIARISPSVLYDEATATILNPGVRVLGPILSTQAEGAIAGALPLGQSVLLVWPHITSLIAATMICFALSYIVFMRQEIRAG